MQRGVVDFAIEGVVGPRLPEQLVEGMLASSAGNPGDRTLTVETVRFVTNDVALVDARYEIAGAQGVRKMWSTFLVVKSADGWRIAAIRNMLPAQ